jgi:hypothetical protein
VRAFSGVSLGSRGKLLVKRSGPTLRTAPDIALDLVIIRSIRAKRRYLE